ncbi:MAG: tetratricopeptide repeat protein [Ktedonobacteraceae bacterium]|nr:tetratricopeptide repeat protein [Ktedonobacteraceae bacterium]
MNNLPTYTQLPQGTVTLLFTDIEGSTRLLQQLGGDQYGPLLAETRELLQSIFEKWHGSIVDTQGDAFFVAFVRASDAIAAAIEAQYTFATHPFPGGASVSIRMGIHTGEPRLVSSGYIGMDVHRSARIMGAGHGGQVLLSQTTRDLVEHDLPEGASIQYLGVYGLKDIAGETPLYQLSVAGLPDTFPSPITSKAQNRLHGFSSQPTTFVGREQELATISRLLRCNDVRLLTLVGTAGVGKTRLAKQVATEISDIFLDGIYFVALAMVDNADAVLPTTARVLGVREESGQSLLELVKDALQEKRLLLVLDNAEQVVASALLLADLLASCPLLKILVTSREVLRIQAEQVFEVRPLAVPDLAHLRAKDNLTEYASITLFVERAQTVKPDFQLNAVNAQPVAKICARLDGIPLAIELAGARIKYLTPQTLLTQLEQGLIALKGNVRDVPARQQTLRNAIAWSYDLLDTGQQQLFRRLAVFVGGCTPEAAERVCLIADEQQGEIQEELEALVDKSLLRLEEQEAGEQRFSMLQTLREYALERLAAAGEMEATQEAHALYYLDEAEKIAPWLQEAETVYWLDKLEIEHKNMQAALSWLLERAKSENIRIDQALRLCTALSDLWKIRSYFQEGHRFLERLVTLSKGSPPSIRAEVLYQISFMAFIQDDMESAALFLEESLAIFRVLGDKLSTAKALRTLAQQKAMSTTTEAHALMEEALTLFKEIGETEWFTFARSDLARIAIVQGNYTEARALLEESLADFEVRGNRYIYNKAFPLAFLASALFLSGKEQAKAQALAEESLTSFREVGNQRFAAYVLNMLGRMALQRGDFEEARKLCEESVELFDEVCYRVGVAEALTSLARVRAAQGDDEAAQDCYARSWALLLKTLDAKELCASCLEGWGELVARQGKLEQAAQMWAAAATLRAGLVAPMPPIYHPTYNQAVAAVREQLGTKAFQAAWAEGRKLSPAQIKM